ncbi:hypothetical protein F0L74_19925 [Chitinophaga agrisoli]|uniref:Outer membrane protein beta-barrel domain-containing protein n=1 Tax=Chitinophaga agrisoli TaxID=2607653 RepID=A0A5B2VHT7_9BACT|nr:hypothetical protein [Chitinophaga agrisoli]KAA2238494.1 hypothetical protein F0L74_19925 [Chitinophaga agrisoli]
MRSTIIRTALIIIVCIAGYLRASAQQAPGWSLEMGVNTGLSTTSVFGLVMGGDLRLEKGISRSTDLTVTTGFAHFFERNKQEFTWHSGYGSPYNVLPVKVGFKTFVGKHWYMAGEAGLGFGFEEWSPSFVWAPAGGYSFGNGLDISLRYEDFAKSKDTKQFALRLAYSLWRSDRSGQHVRPLIHPLWRNKSDWDMQVGLSLGGSTDNSFEPVTGVDLRVQKRIVPSLYGMLTAGFTRFFNPLPWLATWPDGTPFPGQTENYYNLFPIKGGLQLFALGNLYLTGEAGIGINTNGNSSFIWSPGVGLIFNDRLDVGLRFETFTALTHANQLALRVAYSFKPGR